MSPASTQAQAEPGAGGPSPPSFPTRRSRIVRDAVFAAALAAWIGAMLAVWRETRSQALTGEPTELAVFTDAFEQNLRLLVTLRAPGCEVRGEAVRRTKEPYDGKLVVRERTRVAGTAMGLAVVAEVDSETHWDRGSGGFRRMRQRWHVSVPGLADRVVNVTASRSRDPRAGDALVMRTDAPGFDPHRPVAIRIPRDVDVSAGFMAPAGIRPVRTGLRWEHETLDPLSGRMELARVEVVEKGSVKVAGRQTPAYRAVTSVEKETGRSVEVAETWYDADGRALVQTLRFAVIEFTLERAERLAASDEEWEKMEMPAADAPAGLTDGL